MRRAGLLLVVAVAMAVTRLEGWWRPIAYRQYLQVVSEVLASREMRQASALEQAGALTDEALADADGLLREAAVTNRGYGWLGELRGDPRLAAGVWRWLRRGFAVVVLVEAVIVLGWAFSWDKVWAGLPGTAEWVVGTALAAAVLAVLVARAVLFRRRAREWRDRVRDEVVVPYLRQRLNAVVESRGTELSIRQAPGLSGLPEPGRLVTREVIDRARELMDDLESGAIAVAGPRGAGKTTLLRAVGDPALVVGEPTELRVLVSAPVDYQAYDFVLHLYLRLCEAVLTAIGGRRRPARMAGWLRHRWLAAVVLVAGLGLVGWQLYRPLAALPALTPRLAGLAAGAGVALVGLIGLVVWRGPGPRYGESRRLTMGQRAARGRDQLRFLRTYTTGGGAGLAGPAGLSLSHSRSRQVAEQRLTLPELVASYRDFAQAAADWWRRTRYGRRVVVCVDELDRIAEPAKVERFVNDLKAMFGTADCLYLVSVSEEALAVLDRRAVGARTALDSTFDEVIRVGPAGVAVSVELLQRRVIGMPYPFLLFCHCLAGGLPRDVIRTARAVLAASRTAPDNRLPTVAERVARSDGERSTRGLVGRLTTLPPSAEVDALLTALDDPAWPGRTAAGIGAALDRLPAVTDPDLVAVVDQLTGAWSFTAAVLDLFVDRWQEVVELFDDKTGDGGGEDGPDPGELDPYDPDWYRILRRGEPGYRSFRYGRLLYEETAGGGFTAVEPVWLRLGDTGRLAPEWEPWDGRHERRDALRADRRRAATLALVDRLVRPLVQARASLAVSPSLARAQLDRFRAGLAGRSLAEAARDLARDPG